MLRHFFAIGNGSVKDLLGHPDSAVLVENLGVEFVHFVFREDQGAANEDRGFNGGQAQAVLFAGFRVWHGFQTVYLARQALELRIAFNRSLIRSYTRVSVYTAGYRRREDIVDSDIGHLTNRAVQEVVGFRVSSPLHIPRIAATRPEHGDRP